MADTIESILDRINEGYLSQGEQEGVLNSLDALFSRGEKRNYTNSYVLVNRLMANPQNREDVYRNLTSLYDLSFRIELNSREDIRKILDYCKLETLRYISYNQPLDEAKVRSEGMEGRINEISDNLNKITKKSEEYEKQSKAIEQSINDSTSRSVTILSIFAGVVIAFMGGVSLLSSAFTAIQSEASIYRILFMLTLVGFVIYNIIISLMFMIGRFNGRDVGVRCKYRYDCHACHHARPGKISRVFCQAVNKYPYIFCVDAFLVYVMYVVFVLWLYSGNNTDVFNELFESLPFLHLWPVEIIAICAPIPAFIFTTKRPRRKIKNEEMKNDPYDSREEL